MYGDEYMNELTKDILILKNIGSSRIGSRFNESSKDSLWTRRDVLIQTSNAKPLTLPGYHYVIHEIK